MLYKENNKIIVMENFIRQFNEIKYYKILN